MSKKKILVVDDSEICREMARFLLESGGYEVVTLDSPFGFSTALGRERPNLVLVDANMPAIQGDMLIRLAHQHGLTDCPIVMYSDRPAQELQALAASSGAEGFISKTADPDKLWREVELYMRRGPNHHARAPYGVSVRTDAELGPISNRNPTATRSPSQPALPLLTVPPPSHPASTPPISGPVTIAPPTSRPAASGTREIGASPSSRNPRANDADSDSSRLPYPRANRGS